MHYIQISPMQMLCTIATFFLQKEKQTSSKLKQKKTKIISSTITEQIQAFIFGNIL